MKYQPPFVWGAVPATPGTYNANADASYVNGDPTIAREGSYIPGEAIEHAMREIVAVITAAGLTPDHLTLTQLAQAIARHAAGGAFFGVCSGAADTYTVAGTGAFVVPSALFSGLMIVTRPSATNTGPSTAAVFGLSAKSILSFSGAALAGGELVSGRPTAWLYDEAAAAGAGAWLVLPWSDAGQINTLQASLDRLLIYPEINTVSGTLAVTAAGGQITIDAGQTFLHRGHRLIATSATAVGSRQFATAANKTYHLEWSWAAGAGTYALVDRTGAVPAETDVSYDTSYDRMLIARVVTNGSNAATVTPLVNRSRLSGAAVSSGSCTTSSRTNQAQRVVALTLNWARTPLFIAAATQEDFNPADSPSPQFTAFPVDLDMTLTWSVTRYTATVTQTRDFTDTLGFSATYIA